jgi:nucleoside-diphosphate-sugar epimerase
MRVLVTGHAGYIGLVLVPLLLEAGHEVTGLDSFLFEPCTYGDGAEAAVEELRLDLRDVGPEHLEGVEAVVHLAALCNDPLGDLSPPLTDEINHRAAVRLARLARAAGVERFLFSSSCSQYGAQGDGLIGEDAPFRPVTPYGRSKVDAELGIARLADDSFSPTFLRNGTAYGYSRRTRGDLVVNNLTALAFTTGEVRMRSDGTPWRPLVHIEDIARAFVAALEAPRALVHGEAFNVGASDENYQVRDVAAIVEEVVPGSRVTLAEGAAPDLRNYRVSCDKLASMLPAARPRWTVRRGVEQLHEQFRRHGLTLEELASARFMRLQHVLDLQAAGLLDESLRRAGAAAGRGRG